VSKDHRLWEQQLSQRSKHGSDTTLERLVYPALDFSQLTGGAVLRLALGILKKTVEGLEDEFAEAMLPMKRKK
jgi:hypothetical protein